MEFKNMTVEELTARQDEIRTLVEAEDADLDALEAEARGIKEELEARVATEAKKQEVRDMLAAGQIPVQEVRTVETQEVKKVTNEEIRNSKKYIDAFAEYIKTGDDSECRALLTENVSGGTVPVPTFVSDVVKTAWDREGIMRRVKKTYLKGNIKIGFEISGSDAVNHTEGGAAVSEEELIEGIVELVPASIKKWISVSDEVCDMRGREFLDYIYNELAYRIAKKAVDNLISDIDACGTVSTTTCPSVGKITATTITMGLVAEAVGNLSDEASNPIIMMNKATWAKFKAVKYANGFDADPFEGLDVEYNSTIKSFDAASTGDTWLIVGDLGEGAQANMPNGEDIEFKFDDKTLMTSDMVRILGRTYVAAKVIAPKAFCKVAK